MTPEQKLEVALAIEALGRRSGRAVLRHVFDQLEAEVDEDIVGTVYEEHVANRTNGECTNMAELKDIIASKLELV